MNAVNWIAGEEPEELATAPEHRAQLQVKLRHGPTLALATVERQGQGASHSYRVTLTRRDKGIAPGQFAAFYSLHSGKTCECAY